MNAENQNPIAFLIEFLLELIGIDPPSKGYQFVGKLYQDYTNRWQVHYKRPGDRFWSVFPLVLSQEMTQFLVGYVGRKSGAFRKGLRTSNPV